MAGADQLSLHWLEIALLVILSIASADTFFYVCLIILLCMLSVQKY